MWWHPKVSCPEYAIVCRHWAMSHISRSCELIPMLDKCLPLPQRGYNRSVILLLKQPICHSKYLCFLLTFQSCATLYSGLLLSIVILITKLHIYSNKYNILSQIVKYIITSRPMPFVACRLLRILKEMSLMDNFLVTYCPGTSAGNLKLDYDQGVLLYKKGKCNCVKHTSDVNL